MAEQSLNFVHQRIRPRSKLVLFSILAVVLMLLDNRYAAVQQAKSQVATALYPLQWLAHKPVALFRQVSAYSQNQQALVAENAQLRDQQARLQLQLQQQAAQLQALDSVAAVTRLQADALPQAVSAQVISTGKNPLVDHLIIDQGSRAGIRLGDPVADEHGLLGQISAVQPLSAEVTLITNGQTVIPAMVARTGVRTLVYGKVGGLDLRYFPATASLQAGDILVTSGMDSVYPAGIPIATVLQAEAGNGAPYYRTQLQPAAGHRSARFLLVIPQQALPAAAAGSEPAPTP